MPQSGWILVELRPREKNPLDTLCQDESMVAASLKFGPAEAG